MSEIQIFYGGMQPENRLIPGPSISVSVQPQYSNDTIIGHTYNINLTGSVTALDLRETPEDSNDIKYGIGAIIDHIYKLRKILSQNGNILYIVDTTNNTDILKAKGGILRSFNIEDSPNVWNHYVNYSATLEFNSIDFMGYAEDCGSVFFDSTSFTNNTAGIIDLNKFKIKSFSDSWSINFDETESFNRITNTEVGSANLNINNTSFTVEYTINAVGKHFFIYEDELQPPKLLPAWEHAKNFVQYRLYNQATNLINKVLKNTYNNGCSSTDGLNDILIPGFNDGLLSSLGDGSYSVYNEEITCEASESEGSFSATYKAIIKNKISNNFYTADNVKHKINKKITKNTDNKGVITNTISINGTIEGLVEGGLVRIPSPIELPDKGAFLVKKSSSNNKYLNAKSVLDKIYNPNSYTNGIGNDGKRDLNTGFKDTLGITLSSLNATQASDDERQDPPHPISFNLTHDYDNGIINYAVEYSNISCSRQYKDITIQTSNPTKIIATFNIPNSNSCPVIQELGTYTAKTVSITIQGVDLSEKGKPTTINLSSLVACSACDDVGYFPVSLPVNNYILTEKKLTANPTDGSFTINLGYLCKEGCEIQD